ncbi:MAG: carboxypeptidase regulatory-like domain-containing protein [Planctomycetes bacterium]|nr:carboxypeptidase regulatory-like domain-containing protein [Planctomycetota bacterium]
MSLRVTLAATIVSLLLFSGLAWLVYHGSTPGAPEQQEASASKERPRGGGAPGASSGEGNPGGLQAPPGAGGQAGTALPNRERPGGAKGGAGGSGQPQGGTGEQGSQGSTSSAAGQNSSGGQVEGTAAINVALEDRNRQPVAGASVAIHSLLTKAQQSTDQQGTASFTRLPAGSYQVQVEAAGFPRLQVKQPVQVSAGEEKEVRLTLRPYERSVSGRVLAPDGQPISGVGVTAALMDRADGYGVLARERPEEVHSDGEGKFTIDGLTDGEYTVETLPFERYPAARRNVIAPAEGVDLVLHVEVEVTLFGAVTGPGGEPVAEAAVTASSPGGKAVTGGDGKYRVAVKIKKSPGAGVSVSARKEGYAAAEKFVSSDEIKDREEFQVDLQMRQEDGDSTVTGRLTDQSGNGVPGEKIYLYSTQLNAQYSSLSSADGSFRFTGVRAHTDYRLYVYPQKGYRDKALAPLQIDPGENVFDLALEPIEEGVLEGVLLDAGGAPVPGFTIWVRNLQTLGNSRTASTDDAGRFRIEGAPAGELLLETRALPKISVRGIKVLPEQENHVEVIIGVGKLNVKGTVVSKDGAPLAGIRVFFTWNGQRGELQSSLYQEAISDAAGRFSIPGVGSGACAVFVNTADFKSYRKAFDLPAGGPAPDLRLELEK